MAVEYHGNVVVVIIDGGEFDTLVNALELDESVAPWRDGWLSQRFTAFLNRDADTEHLFLRFGLESGHAIAMVDVAYDDDFRRWAGRFIGEFN